MGGELGFDANCTGIEFVPTEGGTFFVTGESATDEFAISTSLNGKV